MHWIDGHLDLAYLPLAGRNLRRPVDDPQIGCVSLPALRDGNVKVVFATIFTEPSTKSSEPWTYPASDDVDAAKRAGLRQLDVYEQLEREGEVTIVRERDDLDRESPLPKLVLLMEGADPIRSPEHLTMWHERGVRIIGMTWAAGTRYAGGNSRQAHGPLTAMGRELVHAMDELGMIHDVSHLADASFDDLLETARGPIIASHSNCRSLVSDRQRHLRDDQIMRIGERGGVIGLNLFADFIVPDGTAAVANAIDHVERVATLMGHRRGVALGSDMDGGFPPADLVENVRPATLHLLTDELSSRGWSSTETADFAHGNWHRFLCEHSVTLGA